jgi:hypothetical protein
MTITDIGLTLYFCSGVLIFCCGIYSISVSENIKKDAKTNMVVLAFGVFCVLLACSFFAMNHTKYEQQYNEYTMAYESAYNTACTNGYADGVNGTADTYVKMLEYQQMRKTHSEDLIQSTYVDYWLKGYTDNKIKR